MKELKFCIDESVDFPVVRFLRKKGFNVKSISEDSPSIEDMKMKIWKFSTLLSKKVGS
mgnify:CR=1 FL=1